MREQASQQLRTYSLLAAIGAVVVSPLLALAYFGTTEGAESFDEAVYTGWVDPVRDVANGLITFASNDTVYATYTLALALLFPAIILAARAMRSQRGTGTRVEMWGWRIGLAGYTLFGGGLLVVSVLLFLLGPESGLVNGIFLLAVIPGLLLGLVGSTMLGAALLRSGYRPRLTAWLLTLAIPLWFVGSAVLGHNSLGVIPLFVAWAVATHSG
jgi:hypothetical protein